MTTKLKRAQELCLGDVITEIHGESAQLAAKTEGGASLGSSGSVTVLALGHSDAESLDSKWIKVTAIVGHQTGTIMLYPREPVEVVDTEVTEDAEVPRSGRQS